MVSRIQIGTKLGQGQSDGLENLGGYQYADVV